MEKDHLTRKLAVILHADVVGSTLLVQQNETLAHERIQAAFHHFSETIKTYGGITRELRGDALVAEFERASDAVPAALAFQVLNEEFNSKLDDDIQPQLRIGISLGEVIIADNTITGAGVVLAQRLEQLAEPNGIVVQGSVSETVPSRMPFEFESLGDQTLKGFDQPVRAFSAKLKPDEVLPVPELDVGLRKARVDGPEIPEKPSIAVLAFNNLSNDPGQDYLSDGISENIIAGLSQFPELFVIARQSSFSYKGKSIKVQQIASELGVHFILEGSVLKSEDRVRVTAQLVNALTGQDLWAQRYDRKWEDIFELQDDITQHIIANLTSLEGPLEEATLIKIEQKAPSDLRAYDYLLLGREQLFLVTNESNIKARKLFQKSLEIEPNYSRGHTWMAWTHVVDLNFGWTENSTKSGETSLFHAQRAVELDNFDAEAHWALAAMMIHAGPQQQKALAEYQKAISLSPNNADLLAEHGWSISKIGKADDGVKSIKQAMRLNPVHPDWYSQGLIFALYSAKRYEEVVEAAEKINVRHLPTFLELAGSYAQLGRKDEAEEAALNALKLQPEFSLSWWRERLRFSNPEALEDYMEGLIKAGLPA
jgi:adenylate cyclase